VAAKLDEIPLPKNFRFQLFGRPPSASTSSARASRSNGREPALTFAAREDSFCSDQKVMKTISIHEAKAHFSEVLSEVQEEGISVILSRYGHPVAEIKPLSPRERCIPHKHLSQVRIHWDPRKPTTEEWANVHDFAHFPLPALVETPLQRRRTSAKGLLEKIFLFLAF
jgi:prevent-host-death family protein